MPMPSKESKKAKREISQQLNISFYINKNYKNRALFDFLNPIAMLSTYLYNQCIFFSKLLYDHDTLPEVSQVAQLCKEATPPRDYYHQMTSISDDNFASCTVIKHYGAIASYLGLKKTDKILNGTPQFPRYKDTSIIVPRRCFSSRVRCGKNSTKPIIKKIVGKNGHENYWLCIQITKDIWIPIPRGCYIDDIKNLPDFKDVNFIPINSIKYKIELCYTRPLSVVPLDRSRYLNIDLGVENFASCIGSEPTLYPVLLNGKEILGINKIYMNKLCNKTKDISDPAILMKNGMIRFNKIASIQHKIDKLVDAGVVNESVSTETSIVKNLRYRRRMKIMDIFHKYSNFIVQYCKYYDIGAIIIGENKGWKQKTKQTKGVDGNRKFGKTVTRIFQYIPYDTFKKILEYKCKMNNIEYHPTGESYTSQVDNICGEPLEYSPTNKLEGTKRNMILRDKSGEPIRKKNGYLAKSGHLFRSSSGIVIHADINGAIGISRKYMIENGLNEIDFSRHVQLRTIFTPIRIKYDELNTPPDIFTKKKFNVVRR